MDQLKSGSQSPKNFHFLKYVFEFNTHLMKMWHLRLYIMYILIFSVNIMTREKKGKVATESYFRN